MTGFFGGLSGMQGAMRSAFLAKSGLGKEAFIATGAVIAAAASCPAEPRIRGRACGPCDWTCRWPRDSS